MLRSRLAQKVGAKGSAEIEVGRSWEKLGRTLLMGKVPVRRRYLTALGKITRSEEERTWWKVRS